MLCLCQVASSQDIYGYDILMMSVERMVVPAVEVLLQNEVAREASLKRTSIYKDSLKELAQKSVTQLESNKEDLLGQLVKLEVDINAPDFSIEQYVPGSTEKLEKAKLILSMILEHSPADKAEL